MRKTPPVTIHLSKQKRLQLLLLFTVIMICSYYSVVTLLPLRAFSVRPSAEINPAAIDKYYSALPWKYGGQGLVGEACVIPRTPAIPEYFRKHWRPSESFQDCGTTGTKLVTLSSDTPPVLKLLPRADATSCCIQGVHRGLNDSEIRLTSCDPIKDGDPLGDKEAFVVRCDGRIIQADAAIPVDKPHVQTKLNHWKGIDKDSRPPSVFLFGFDSVSRAHAYRSLPQSIELMMSLDFIDFSSYHSLAPSTLTNFMGFLMGLSRNQVRGSCAPNWAAPFDACPLIWKEFSQRNYVTSYVEDGSQTFNWGGQSGFVDQPTDYYIHHLFKAVEDEAPADQQKWWSKLFKSNEVDCLSQEEMPELLVRYNMEFLKKFAEIPFFSFTWFANPFHDDMYALPNFDSRLSKLFEMLSMNKALLDNAIFIFLSDHGDRTNFFSGNAPESYFERGLPPLFIRLPNKLRQKFPQISENLKHNSGKFTTPFDIHETLLHVLEINNKKGLENYSSGAKDSRSTLFSILAPDRTCASTNVPEANCLCNVEYDNNNKRMFRLTLDLSSYLFDICIRHLNLQVGSSVYRDKCSTWSGDSSKDIIYTRVISGGGSYAEVVVAFTAYPGESKFETRFRLKFGEQSKMRRVKAVEILGFTRINRYGDQSWCVGGETDKDKQMKEFCVCKKSRQ